MKSIAVYVFLFVGCLCGLRLADAQSIQDLSATYRWQNAPIGGGGYFINVLPHPTRPDVLYVNSDMTGPFVRQTPDDPFVNTSYTSHAFEHPTNTINAASGIAIAAARPDTVFVSIRGNGLLRSTDAGKTYEVVHPVSSFTKHNGPEIAIDPANPDIVYRGTDDDGLFRSTRGGAPGSWEQVVVAPDAKEKATHLAIFPPNAAMVDGVTQVLYVGIPGLGVHVSRDGGQTFAMVPENTVEAAGEVPENVVLLEDPLEAGKNKLPKGWQLLDTWMRGAVRIGSDENRRWLVAGEKGKFAQRLVDLPSNVVEVTLTLDAQTEGLEAGKKPHETAGAQIVFVLGDGKRKKAN